MPDPDDSRVLAAVIVGRATASSPQFPPETLEACSIEIVAYRRHRAAMGEGAPTPDDYLVSFERCGLIQAHQRPSGHKKLLLKKGAAGRAP
jgi:hypothetical protein